jgi:hypothetical protein
MYLTADSFYFASQLENLGISHLVWAYVMVLESLSLRITHHEISKRLSVGEKKRLAPSVTCTWPPDYAITCRDPCPDTAGALELRRECYQL